MHFKDRTDAGRQLAAQLIQYRSQAPIVLGLPRGGVVVAYEVARALEAPLDILVARKLGAPDNPELGIGAIAAGGVRVLDDRAVQVLGISAAELEQITAHESMELQRRLQRYRADQPALPLTKRMVILVDDGLATGVTALAAIRSLRAQAPARIVLAVPVSAPDTARSLRDEVDELVTLTAPPNFQAVGQFYANFAQTSDEEVIALLELARRQGDSGHGAEA